MSIIFINILSDQAYCHGSTDTLSLSGTVWMDSVPMTEGKVIIRLANTPGDVPPVSEMSVTNGVFEFTNLEVGEYIVLAIPEDTIHYYPTYYANAIVESYALILRVELPVISVDINLIPKRIDVFNPDFHKYEVSLFPNPANSQITITNLNPVGGDITIEVFDLFGRKLIREVFEQNSIVEATISNINIGNYVVKVSQGYFQNSTLIVKY